MFWDIIVEIVAGPNSKERVELLKQNSIITWFQKLENESLRWSIRNICQISRKNEGLNVEISKDIWGEKAKSLINIV